MRFTRTHLLAALGVLFGVLILWAVAKLYGVTFGPLVDELLPNAVFFGMIAVFLINRWQRRQDEKEAEKKEEKKDEPDNQ